MSAVLSGYLPDYENDHCLSLVRPIAPLIQQYIRRREAEQFQIISSLCGELRHAISGAHKDLQESLSAFVQVFSDDITFWSSQGHTAFESLGILSTMTRRLQRQRRKIH
jgi:hypothetical protein